MIKRVLRNSFFKYIVVGLASFVVDYGLLLLLFHGFSMNAGLASAFGLAVGFVVNFSLNKMWSFNAAQGGRRQTARQVVLYSALVGVNLIFTSWFISYVLVRGVPPEISKLVTVGIITLWNYALYKVLIFKTPANTAVDTD